ncbi:MAG: tetratricopeptide repeat protein [Nannocystaceae bacterium]|nr:hypothetical protein [bacterium]
MTTSPTDELELLIAAERERPDAGAEAADRVLAGVHARLDGAPPPASVPANTPWGLLAVVGGLLVGGLVVGGLVVGDWAASLPPEPAHFEPLPAPALAVVAERPVIPELREELPRPDTQPGPATSAEPAAKRPKRENAGTVADELALIEGARAALDGGKARAALGTLDKHRRQFPKGAFREEAAALRASALCKAGKVSAAQKASASFLRRYPNSVHRNRAQACPH